MIRSILILLLVLTLPAAGVGTGFGQPPREAPSLPQLTGDALLDSVQEASFRFFWNEVNPANGLIRDRTQPWSPASIASMGFGLSAICVGVDHGWIARAEGRDRVLATLQNLWTMPQSSAASGVIGYKGLYYHFLDMTTSTRTWDCELSTIDTALLFAGIIDCKQFFDAADPGEEQIRALADSIYYRADWNFMRNFNPGILMGWKPGTGFSGFGQWIGYNEAMILYILALGSPTFPVPASAWNAWTSGYVWSTYYGQSYVIFPPLFGHQYSHCWIDFRDIHDAYMDNRGITYFENSRRATYAARSYCTANPFGHIGYSDLVWGLTACDGPEPFGYRARGGPPAQNDDGTIAPTAAAASIAFAPEIVIPTLEAFYNGFGSLLWGPYGFRDAFNLNYAWWDTDYIGIDQGPIVLMIENYRTGRVWERFMANEDVQRGLQRAGFSSVVGLPDGGVPPARLALGQNAPNPFRAATVFPYSLDAPGHVAIDVFDASGRRVQRVLDRSMPAGDHQIRLQGEDLPAGVYMVRLQVDGVSAATRRCLRLK